MKLTAMFCCVVAAFCAPGHAYTLSFDETAPPGAPPWWNVLGFYEDTYGALFGGFVVADHSGSTWGTPRSGTNVLSYGVQIKFGFTDTDPYTPYAICSFSGYFSTEMGAVIDIVGYHGNHWHPVASARVGAPGESWSNQYVEISSAAGDIDYLLFHAVTPDGLAHYCADDITVVPVPNLPLSPPFSAAWAGCC